MQGNLYETMQNFWLFWFGEGLAGTETLNLAAFCSVVLIVYIFFFYIPLGLLTGKFFRKRGKK